MSWTTSYEEVRKHLFKIETPDGYGTGFLFVYNSTRTAIGIATANHVLANADRWQQPIYVTHALSQHQVLLAPSDRVVYPDANRDTAALLIFQGTESVAELMKHLPQNPMTLVEATKYMRVGTPVGWIGYPAIVPETLCFFRGHVSAFQQGTDAYLIDGVSIHGLSGGPVFTDEKNPQVLGSISAYLPNRSAGATLPGLIQAYDLTALHNTITRIRNVDDARAQAAEAAKQAEAAQANQATAVPVPPLSQPTLVAPPAASDGATKSAAPETDAATGSQLTVANRATRTLT